MPKMMEMGHFWDQNQHVWTFLQIASSNWNKWAFLGSNALFWNSVPWIFLKLCLMTGIEKWVKVRVWDFKGKLLLCCPKWGKWSFLDPISTFWNFPQFCSLDFYEIVPDDRLWKVLLSNWFVFKGKIIIHRMGEKSAHLNLEMGQVLELGSNVTWYLFV